MNLIMQIATARILLRELVALAEVGDADQHEGWHTVLENARNFLKDPTTSESEVRDYVIGADALLKGLVEHGIVPRHYKATQRTAEELHTLATQLLK